MEIRTEYLDHDKHGQGGPIELFIRAPDEINLDLNNSKLEINFTNTLENGNDLTGWDSVGPLTDILNALLMSMEIELGGVLVTDRNTKYWFRAVFENLINYNKLISDSRLSVEGCKKDMATQCEVTNPALGNTGLTARTAGFASGTVVTLIGALI